MTQRRMLRGVLGALVGLIALLLVQPPAASARAPDAQGWWYVARSSEIPIATPVPPTVEDDGLYVAAGPNGAIAVAAVRAQIGEVTGAVLTLTLNDSSGVVTMGACRTNPWNPDQAGNWEQRPDPDCDAGSVGGILSDDGTTVTFDLGALVANGNIDVVILPGDDADGTPPNFTASILRPDENSLTTATTPAAPPPAPASPPVGAGSNAPPPVAAGPPTVSPPSFRPASGVATVSEPATAIEIPDQTVEVAAPLDRPLDRPVAASTGADVSDPGRLLGLAIVAAVAVGLVVLRNREGPMPTPLLAIVGRGTTSGGDPASRTVTSGVGRFAGERIGRPPPLT